MKLILLENIDCLSVLLTKIPPVWPDMDFFFNLRRIRRWFHWSVKLRINHMVQRLSRYVVCVLTLNGIDFNYDVHITESLFALIFLCGTSKCRWPLSLYLIAFYCPYLGRQRLFCKKSEMVDRFGSINIFITQVISCGMCYLYELPSWRYPCGIL